MPVRLMKTTGSLNMSMIPMVGTGDFFLKSLFPEIYPEIITFHTMILLTRLLAIARAHLQIAFQDSADNGVQANLIFLSLALIFARRGRFFPGDSRKSQG